MLPLEWLLERLKNEEQELSKRFPELRFNVENLYDKRRGSGKYLKIPTPIGIDEVEVVRVYKFSGLRANGYVKLGDKIDKALYHNFNLYILRSYPVGLLTMKNILKRPLYEAPIRVRYMSNIFHPNILPGPDYIDDEYAGTICWAVYSEWLPSLTLDKLVEGFKMMIENPNPNDPLRNRPICREAAKFFSREGSTSKQEGEEREPIILED
jgi:hypothetical protein